MKNPRPTQPYYTAQNQVSAGQATNCSHNAYTGWPALLAALFFLLITNLSDSIFSDVLGALQTLAHATGYFALPTPCDAFLIALRKAALSPHVIAALDEPQQSSSTLHSPISLKGLTLSLAEGSEGSTTPQPLGLSSLACL